MKALKKSQNSRNFSVSVIVPCFNEEDNIEQCIKRIPDLGKRTEIVVVDDGSLDGTANIVRRIGKLNKKVKLLSYCPNRGKGYAVNLGMTKASGDILVILDADMTVVPKDLPKFVKPLVSGVAGFVNGTRLTTKMEQGAMKRFNLFGNKLMGFLFSLAIGQKITDSLCGTKALFKKDFIRMGGIHKDDPWSDFSLIFGAARLHLPIVEVSVIYKRRLFGKSKMKLLQHGTRLSKVFWKQYWQYRTLGSR